MVKTRHTPDVDDETSGNFISLETRRTRLSREAPTHDVDGSDDSGVVQFKDGRRRPGRPAADEDISPVTKRSPRAAAKRVSYVEDCIDDEFPRRRSGRPPRALVIEDEIVEDSNDMKNVQLDGTTSGPDDSPRASRSSRTGKRVILSPLQTRRARGSSDMGLRQRKTSDYLVLHPSPSQALSLKREKLAEEEDGGIRRSSRQRKLMHHTFDQNIMLQKYSGDEQKRKRQRLDVDTENEADTEEGDREGFTDMYSRVKRKRISIKRDMYGMPLEESDDGNHEDDDDEDDDDDGSDDDDEEENEEEENDGNEEEKTDEDKQSNKRSYYLRENKPRTQHYNSSQYERGRRPRSQSRFFTDEITTPHSPARRRRPKLPTYMSPARRKVRVSNRRRAAFHGSSSTSSSSSDSSSSDEERFQRRKAKSMLKSRQRCLPMNFDPDDISKSNILRDRQKIGSSLADVDPMTIDRSITFDSVGGLGKHVRALKEMVVFPLLYPEIFERFKVSPPRGVLFYGPPGTGKTLVARALANECSSDDRRVAFYMRKGADCLSKWVGESERQLRLLFDQAYQTRPSIIFFDEIDGLAPVRSSRQDQIHSSIVSTLLALMDGLDCRGEIVVIGATNRIDSLDPALRRPGRFDREFLFPLPSLQARSQILKIHTKEWNPRLCNKFVTEVAEKCLGYCGADMKALCTEAALLALRRRYPQIYTSSEKLQIDVSSINIGAKDFFQGMQNIIPTSQRSVTSPARSLSSKIAPLLQALFTEVMTALSEIFPSVLSQLANLDAPVSDKVTGGEEISNPTDVEIASDDENCTAIYEQKVDKRRRSFNIPTVPDSFLNFTSYANRHPSTHRPRLLLCGTNDQGQTSHLAPAVLHNLEQLPVHVLDLPALFAVSARTPEESCAQIFREARRTAPSIVYLPHINQWWNIVGETIRSTLLTLIIDLDPSSPLLLLATSEEKYSDMNFALQDLFDEFCGEVVTMRNPSSVERREFFKDLLLNQATLPPPQKKVAAARALEVLPKAPPPEPRKLTEQEMKKLHQHEESSLTELRLFLRDVLNKLGRDRKFFIFTKPVDIEDVPDYYEIIKNPMDLSTMMSKIDLHKYQLVKEFIADIEQICLNALEYNPDKDPQSRVIRHRACALKDTAYAIIKTELDPEFEKICESIVTSRKQRGEDSSKTAPAFYHTRPLNQGPMHPLAISKTPSLSTSRQSKDPNVRISRRIHGGQVDEGPSLEEVEKSARAVRSLTRSPNKENANNSTPQGQLMKTTPTSKNSSGLKKSQVSSLSYKRKILKLVCSSVKKPVKKSIWGSSGYKSRKRRYFKRKRVGDDETVAEDEDNDNQIEADENSENEKIESGEEDMEIEVPEANKSPGRDLRKSPRQEIPDGNKSSRDQSMGKSPRRDSLSKCLSIDVNLKPPKDFQKSPSQRSPRVESQRSPLTDSVRSHSPNSNHESLQKIRLDASQKSPRQRNTSGPRSPRALDSHNTLHTEPIHKSPRHLLPHKSPDKPPKLSPRNSVICDHDENSNQTTPQGPSSDSQENIAEVLTGIDGAPVVVNGFVDSGIGSSDSNGDSNDSASKLTSSSEKNEQIQETGIVQVSTDSKTEKTDTAAQDVEMESKDESPKVRVLRSRIQAKPQAVETEVLQEPVKSVLVDGERLLRLLELTVTLTEDYTVSRLEKLYSLYGQCVFQHRLDYDKTLMTEMMEKRLKQYTSNVAEKLRAERSKEQRVNSILS